MTWREEELETSRAGAGLQGGGEAGRLEQIHLPGAEVSAGWEESGEERRLRTRSWVSRRNPQALSATGLLFPVYSTPRIRHWAAGWTAKCEGYVFVLREQFPVRSRGR